MKLHRPFEISSRLMPALRIGGATLSLNVSGKTDRDGRDIYTVWLDLPDGTEHEITDLKSGCQGGTVLEGFRALLNFLSAAAESRKYRERSTVLESTTDSRWMVLRNGFQWGPKTSTPDASGAYPDTWATEDEALAALAEEDLLGENETLFSPAVVSWAVENDDAISMLSCDIEEDDTLITDED